MTRFTLGKSFQVNENGITEKIDKATRSRIGIVPTRYGEVLAYMTEIEKNSKTNLFAVCPGFYKSELPPKNGYRAVDLSEIPEEKQPGVKEDLEELGYMGTFVW